MSNFQKWLLVAVMLGFGLLLYALAPILTPFLIAGLIAYLGDPVVSRLERWHLPRTQAVVLVFTLIMLLMSLLSIYLVPKLQHQLQLLIQKLPDMLNWLQQVALPWASEKLAIGDDFNLQQVKTHLTAHWQQAGNYASSLGKTLFHSSMALFGWIVNALLIPVVTFYLLRDWDDFMRGLQALLPRAIEPTVRQLVAECTQVLGSFFRGQLLVMFILGAIYAVGLISCGLELGLLIGVLAGLVSIVPYLGPLVGIVAASLAAVVQFHDSLHVIYVLIVFAIGHICESMILTPWLVGDKIGLHPVAVIFAIMACGQLLGFTGVLLALPIAAVFRVLLHYALSHYQASRLYNQASLESNG